jgi:small subunit ribosomal protein S2
MTRKWDQTWLLTFIWNVMVFTLSIYIKLQQKLKKLMTKKSLHQVEKYYSLLPKKTKDIVAEKAKAANMPYITERWPGGMLTN